MRYGPGLREDTKNLSIITGSALVAVALTAGIIGANAGPDWTYDVRWTEAPPSITYDIDRGPVDGSDRIYGTVVTRNGARFAGFIRWDRNEGSWADLLDATKAERGGSISGVRFGHLHRIQPTGRNSAWFVLKSGETIRMKGRATDLGTGMRGLQVEEPAGRTVDLDWGSVDFIEFRSAPDGATAHERRLYGTLTTADGASFTGFIAWDVDEIYTTDILDGQAGSQDMEIPFGAIAAIARVDGRSARVTLQSGEEVVLHGTNDVNASNSGITVSDVGLGQVKVDWSEFAEVRFHEAGPAAGYGVFDGGAALEGTVRTKSGANFSGAVEWDRDEGFGWEMLNGRNQGVEYQVEFGNIQRIVREPSGVEVELRDGRTLRLYDSNDVDSGNRGIRVVTGDGSAHDIPWRDFVEVTFTPGGSSR